MNDQPLYSLTMMTGQEASSTRTAIIGPVELPWRLLMVLVVGFVTGLLPAAVLWTLVGGWALLGLVGWIFLIAWLIHGRTRRGLRVQNYVALLNRRRANLNHFMFGDAIVTVPRQDWRTISSGSKPNPALRVTPEEQLAAEREPAHAKVTALFD